MDKVFIHGLFVKCIVGIYDSERVNKQRVRLDIDMLWDNRPAAQSKDIDKALDYKVVSEAVESLLVESQFLLVETMAEDIFKLLNTQFHVTGARIRVEKPDAIQHIDAVGVEIFRGEWV